MQAPDFTPSIQMTETGVPVIWLLFAIIATIVFTSIFWVVFSLIRDRFKKYDELVKKNEREEAEKQLDLERAAKATTKDAPTPVEERSPKGSSPSNPIPVTGAAPAQHTVAASVASEDLMAPALASDSPESDSSSSSHEEIDSHILSGRGAPIAPGMGEIVAAHLRAQQAMQA